jgi:hypothetical protein
LRFRDRFNNRNCKDGQLSFGKSDGGTIMKLRTLVSTAGLMILLSSAAIVCAQDEHPDAKPPEPRPEATKPRQDEAKPPRQQEEKPPKQQEEKPPKQQEEKPPKQQEEKPPKHAQERPNEERPNVEKPNKQSERAEQQDHRGQQHAAGQGGHIPDDKFNSHFGREHRFVVNRVTVVEGQPRFQYSGYWFALVDAWPEDWAYTDDCYIDYIDGEYFLFDLLHPGIRVAVFVVM